MAECTLSPSLFSLEKEKEGPPWTLSGRVHSKPLFIFILPCSQRFLLFSPSLIHLHLSPSHKATITHSLSLSHYSLSLSLTHHHPCGFFPHFTTVFTSATHHPWRPCVACCPLSGLLCLCRGLPLSPLQFPSLSRCGSSSMAAGALDLSL